MKAQIEQRGQESDGWETLVEQAVEVEDKAGLQPSSYIREIDHRCLGGNRPANTISSKVQTKKTSMKDPRDHRTEKPKPKESQGSNNSGNPLGNSRNSSTKKWILIQNSLSPKWANGT